MALDEKPDRGLAAALLGRSFVHPVFDYLLIGGGLSLMLTAVVLSDRSRGVLFDFTVLPWFMLVSNSAHFASSTVRPIRSRGVDARCPFDGRVSTGCHGVIDRLSVPGRKCGTSFAAIVFDMVTVPLRGSGLWISGDVCVSVRLYAGGIRQATVVVDQHVAVRVCVRG